MLQRLKQFQEIVVALVNEDYVMKALDFAIENDVHGMKLGSLLASVDIAKAAGNDIKAAMIVKRLQELKKFDEAKAKASSNYKPLLVQ